MGCLNCKDSESCSSCDEASHWIKNVDNICVCSHGYISEGLKCVSCSTLISGCTDCTDVSVCFACSEGWTLNSSGKCDENGSNVLMIVLLVIGGIGLLVVAFIVWRCLRKRQKKKMQTLLESETH